MPHQSPLSATLLRWLLLPLLVVVVAMLWVGSPLNGPAAPLGIVSLEFCALTSRCEAILRGWDDRQHAMAMLGLGLDYLFIALYATVIACALLVAADGQSARLQALARVLAWLMALAGLADAVENVGLIRLLLSGVADTLTLIAAVCATAKFAVLGVALVALGVMVTLRLLRQPPQSPRI